MTEDRKENPPDRSGADQPEIPEPSTPESTGLTRRKVLKGAAAVSAAVAVTYVPPSLRRIAMPSTLAKVSPGKEDGEKDPASDKTGDKTTDKDPLTDKTTDKDPSEKSEDKTTDKDPLQDKDPNEKDPTTDKSSEKDPGEKQKEGELRSEIPDLPRFARIFFDEWS